MTSTASPQNISAPITSAATSAPSYASAASATKKPASSTPLIATGSNPPPVVVGSAAQHAKPSSASPVNGRPSITPAVPAMAATPAVVHGSNMNGGAGEHTRKSSVTISANGPNSYAANGGPVGGSKSNIQFGFKDSPAIAHSLPQSTAAPIPIPGGNARIPSPAHSPSPIPQPSASGGRPPSGLQQPGAQMTFGSLGSDGDRHMRQASMPPQNPAALASQQGAHIRRESGVSNHSDLGGPGVPGPGHNRPGFPPQGGRGRGFNPPYNNAQMGFPPGQYRNGGRGGMPPAFHPGRQMQPYPNSPQPNRSPALAQSQPGTPNMPPATMQQMPMQTPPQYHYAPPQMAPQQQQYGYPPQHQANFDQFGRQMPVPYQNYPMQYMGPPQANSQAAFQQQQFVPPQYHAPAPQNMSRTSSHSERPTSSTGQSNQPVVVSGTPQPTIAQAKPPIVSSNNFVRPKKSAAITIKNLQGEALDLTSIKTPASPAPSIQQSKTPPVVTSTPTPPPKPATPAHTRTDSQAAPKTAKEVQDELREKIKQVTKVPVDDKAKEEEAAKADAAKAEATKAEATKAEAAKVEAARLEAAKAKAAEEEKKAAEAKAKAEAEEKVKEDARKAQEAADAEAKRKADADAKAAADKQSEEAAKASAEADEEDEMERMIREMEEAEALREKQAEEYSRKKKIEQEAKKKLEAEQKALTDAENDKKLREQEREMERLEEEREKKRQAGESGGLSVAEALAQAAAGSGAAKEADSPKLGAVTDKLATLNISADSKPSTPTDSPSVPKGTPAEKQRAAKPAALNLVVNTKPVEPPQPSAALQSLKSARFLTVMDQGIYPAGISSPNPALNAAVAKKGKTFKYDAQFLLQFQKVFTEQPSIEFHQQVKTLIGDTDGSRSASTPRPGSGRQNSRAGPNFPPAMGTFNAPPANVRGTNSEQRFAMANAALGRPPPASNTMGTFSRAGGFPVGAQMSRTPSSSNMAMPNSPRQGSRSTRGGSRRNDFNPKDSQAAKTMPLTAGQEVKPIQVTATGWKPMSIGNKAAQPNSMGNQTGHIDPETVQRKVKAALNKMTPEKFDKIADQILAIAAQSKDESDGRTLRQVIQLTFEKATDEAHWASMYAKFCKRMLDMMSSEIRDENIKDKNGVVVSGGALFRKYLLNRCQEEFERGWKVNLPEPKEGEEVKTLEAVMLSEEYYIAAAAKRRGLGLVQFIGELYKLGMLTERIMHECVRKLVDYEGIPDEAEIESLSKLLRTIGGNLDATEKGRMLMNAYFERIQQMADMPDLNSRLRFMLMDVIDLRRVNWASKEANKGPKTLEEVRAEAEAAALQKAQENARSSQRGPPGGRPGIGRGDVRNFSSNFNQPASNQVGMDDLRRLKGSANRIPSQVTLGPTSMFASRSNSGRRLGPGGSLGRAGEESGASSRTGTPPTRESASHSNAFSLLANMDSENPASPPSTAASPSLSKALPDSSAAGDKK